ncbi:DMT family transporter [Rhodobacter sp. Har01]|uniref:DMT family transporter n=1 Tax=Rhodobacter sp. Har01 TaxID=2883999 RepID=UPI001D078B7B|nr:DMT family transporter [Rhodobacter sp. Har01]MCB6177834.1 DMT family transporter [Rhodobacter sp. Har01]
MDGRSLLMGLGFVVLWSSAFATARIIVADAAPLHALALRFLVSGGLAVAVALALGQGWRLTRAQAVLVLVFGLCQNGLYLGLNFVAMQWVPASAAVIIAAAMPLLVAALGWVFRGQQLSGLAVAGLVAGFAGVALAMGTRLHGGVDPLGLALCALGALALAVATLTLRGAAAGGDNLLMVVGLQMLVGAAALGVVAIAAEPFRYEPTWRLLAAFSWQIAGPGLAATLIWFALVGRIGAVRASTFHFLNPFFGVLIAAGLLGEDISRWDALGVAITMAGILAVHLARS